MLTICLMFNLFLLQKKGSSTTPKCYLAVADVHLHGHDNFFFLLLRVDVNASPPACNIVFFIAHQLVPLHGEAGASDAVESDAGPGYEDDSA